MHLDGLAGRIAYAQLLHDALRGAHFDFAQHHRYPTAGQDTLTLSSGARPTLPGRASCGGALTLELPIQRPEVLLPVVELFLEG